MARIEVSASSLLVDVAVAVAVACARGGRVASASRTRHLATSPSRRHASSPSQPTHTHPFNMTLLVRRNVALCFIHFSLYDVLVLLYLYYLLRFHFEWPRESSHSRRIVCVFVARPRLLLSCCSPVFTKRFASHLRRVATLSTMRQSVVTFNQITTYC